METSALCHLASIMGYRAGTICTILANRPKGTILLGEGYGKAVDDCIKVGLETMVDLSCL
jgi:purine-nucleoside phosphorylase